MGQSIPAECMDADVDVLDKTGRVVRTIPGRRSQEQINQQKADSDAVQAAAQRDRTLLATYLSVADIERLRDSRLEQLDQQVLVTRQYITNLRARETRLMQDVQRYRPYSSKTNAPALPEALAAEIVNTVNGLQVYEQELAKNMGDQQQLRAEFDADITRFKELKAPAQVVAATRGRSCRSRRRRGDSCRMCRRSRTPPATGTTTSCAMRSPGSIVNAFCPRLQQDTITCPW
jgi:hypothetical protein